MATKPVPSQLLAIAVGTSLALIGQFWPAPSHGPVSTPDSDLEALSCDSLDPRQTGPNVITLKPNLLVPVCPAMALQARIYPHEDFINQDGFIFVYSRKSAATVVLDLAEALSRVLDLESGSVYLVSYMLGAGSAPTELYLELTSDD